MVKDTTTKILVVYTLECAAKLFFTKLVCREVKEV